MKATASQIAEAIIIRMALNEGDTLKTATELAAILDGLGIEVRDIRRGLPANRWPSDEAMKGVTA